MAAIGMRVAERAHPVEPGNGMPDVPGMAQAADVPDGLWHAVKRRVLGPPLVTEQLTNERLSRPLALGVLSCDRRGHWLAFSNGIIVLTGLSLSLMLVAGATVDALIPFYAIGVFTGFAMAGFGMARYHRRTRLRRPRPEPT
jgi:hypothetical protein